MPADSLPDQMRDAARALLAELGEAQRAQAAQPFADTAARRWLEYRPRPRPGACLAELSVSGRKAAHLLLATGLSEHAYAQAMAIVSLEEVLGRREGWRRGRHSGDYWASVFGDPGGGEPWGWRFEGHHVSVTMTLAGGEVSAAPVFLGANPACVRHAGHPVSRPLAPEEDLARALLDEIGPDGRAEAVVAGQRHYYRVQGDDLLIEYDNTTDDGNHAHTVLRRPRSDFGEDILARHYRQARHDRPAGRQPAGQRFIQSGGRARRAAGRRRTRRRRSRHAARRTG